MASATASDVEVANPDCTLSFSYYEKVRVFYLCTLNVATAAINLNAVAVVLFPIPAADHPCGACSYPLPPAAEEEANAAETGWPLHL